MAISSGRDLDTTRSLLEGWLRHRTGAPSVLVGDIAMPGLSGFSNETLLVDAAWDSGAGLVAHPLVIRIEPSGLDERGRRAGSAPQLRP